MVASKAGGDEEEGKDVDAEEVVKNKATRNNNSTNAYSSGGLNKKLGMEFENVGGLDAQLDDIAVSFPAYLPMSVFLIATN